MEERENGYRHPHCIIVTLSSIQEKKRRACRELYEEHPCTDVELIEESSDSNSWLVLFLCVYCYVLMECLFYCYAFALYMLCM
jgi:hypothetical protein